MEREGYFLFIFRRLSEAAEKWPVLSHVFRVNRTGREKSPCFCAHSDARKNTNKQLSPLLCTARRFLPGKYLLRDAANKPRRLVLFLSL